MLGGAQDDAVPHVCAEAGRLDGEAVGARIEIRDVVGALRRSHAVVNERGIHVDDADPGPADHGPGRVRNSTDDRGSSGRLAQGGRHKQSQQR